MFSEKLQLDGAISDRHELEARRLIKAAEHVQNKIGQYFADTPDIADMCYIRKTRIKSLKSIRRKVEAKISEGQEYGPGSLVDICGFRLITFYQSDIPAIIKHLIQATRSDAGSVTPFRTNAPVLIDINSSRPEIDPLSIVSEIKEAVKKLDPKIEINVTPRVTGYSSVHVIVSCPTGLEDGEVEEISVEVQVRSVLEDVWGELDHKLRYGSQRGGVGVSWARHLNALKTLLDGVIQYLDLIKRHAEEDRLVPPSEIKQARSVEEPEKQMNRLQALPEVIRERLNDAYELWAQADATRPLGGDPGLFRRAADAFLEIITTFDGQPEDDPELASELRYVSQAERAFMLSYTGDPDEVAESVRIYEEILKQRESNVTALFRLGHLTRRQGDLPRSMQLFRKAIDILERGEDERSERLDRSHWVYDATRLNLAVANWRIFQSGSDMAERATALTAAMDLAKSVVDKPADEKQRIRAMNDYLYYLWELQQVDVPAFKRAIRLRTFKAYCAQLKDAVQAGGYEAYEYHDTLMRVMQMVGDVRAAYAAALETRDALERLGRRVFPGITLPENKATYGWTLELTRHLDEDQRDALVYAQDVIRELSTG